MVSLVAGYCSWGRQYLRLRFVVNSFLWVFMELKASDISITSLSMPHSSSCAEKEFKPITAEQAADILTVIPHSHDVEKYITAMVHSIRAKGKITFTTPDAVLTAVTTCMPRPNEKEVIDVETYKNRVRVFFHLLVIRKRVRELGLFLNRQSHLTHTQAQGFLYGRFKEVGTQLSLSKQEGKVGKSCFPHFPLITKHIGGVVLKKNIAAAFDAPEKSSPIRKRERKNANNTNESADRIGKLMTQLEKMAPAEIQQMLDAASTPAKRMEIAMAKNGLEVRRKCGVP